MQQRQKLYSQLYPQQQFTVLSSFFQFCGCVRLAGDTISSTHPGGNNPASSVIMAYWPGSGDNLDYCQMRVGVIQYLVSLQITIVMNIIIFAFVRWKQLHPQQERYGMSVTGTSILLRV